MRFEVRVLVVLELAFETESISRLEVLGVGEAVGELTSRLDPGDDCEEEELLRAELLVLLVCFFLGRYL